MSAKPHRGPTPSETAQPQLVADVLAETESVAREIHAQRETALTAWQTQLLRFRLLVAEAGELAPAAFVKRLRELLPELHQAAMAAVVYAYLTGRMERRESTR